MSTRADADAWFRQPIVWLGALILAASIAGCVALIVLAWRFPDVPVDTDSAHVTSVPLQRSADATPPTEDNR